MKLNEVGSCDIRSLCGSKHEPQISWHPIISIFSSGQPRGLNQKARLHIQVQNSNMLFLTAAAP